MRWNPYKVRKVFAWFPVELNTGQMVWLEYVLKEPYRYHSIYWPLDNHPFGDTV